MRQESVLWHLFVGLQTCFRRGGGEMDAGAEIGIQMGVVTRRKYWTFLRLSRGCNVALSLFLGVPRSEVAMLQPSMRGVIVDDVKAC